MSGINLMTSLCVLGLADNSASKSTQLIRKNINKHRYTIHSRAIYTRKNETRLK